MIEWRQTTTVEPTVPTNKTPIRIELTQNEREILERVAHSFALPHRDVVKGPAHDRLALLRAYPSAILCAP